MPFRNRKFYLVVLIASNLIGMDIVVAAEDSRNELSNDGQTAVDDRIAGGEDKSKNIVVRTSSKEATIQKGRSIKMIVGGQSTDGLAKEVTVPVQD
ncbi:MAG: hypothetical protein ACI9ZT_001105 [Gammaproteobacteria bacterium]|jgi:hypothetical protein